MMQTKKLTLSILAAFGIGLASPGVAGSGHVHSHSGIGSADSAASESQSEMFGTSEAFPESESTVAVFDSPTFDSASDVSSESDSSLYIFAAEPNLLFSDGVWYSFAGGDWYALEDNVWMAESSPSADAALTTSDAYAFDGSEYESIAMDDASSWYYVTDVPYDGTVYTTDGIAWYSSQDDQLVALSPIEVSADSVMTTAMLDGAIVYTYYLL
jgi:hypothetical protein